jgi:hypothetical protein
LRYVQISNSGICLDVEGSVLWYFLELSGFRKVRENSVASLSRDLTPVNQAGYGLGRSVFTILVRGTRERKPNFRYRRLCDDGCLPFQNADMGCAIESIRSHLRKTAVSITTQRRGEFHFGDMA